MSEYGNQGLIGAELVRRYGEKKRFFDKVPYTDVLGLIFKNGDYIKFDVGAGTEKRSDSFTGHELVLRQWHADEVLENLPPLKKGFEHNGRV